MYQYRDPAHYLKPLQTTTTPKRLLWLDCACRSEKEQGLWVDRWQAAALGSTHWTSKRGVRKDTLNTYTDPAEMWQVAANYCTAGRRVVLFAYDLAYQLRVSELLVHLPRAGWHLDKIVLERQASWALLRNGERTLMCCDLKSWAPVDLGKLAADVTGQADFRFTVDAGPNFRADACAMRAEIVRDCVLQILNWIEGENLGAFRPTGSGQSYSAYRRRFMGHNLLVHDDTERLQVERVAMWTGRCEAWRHGKLTDGPFIEFDMQAAYCNIAHECPVPTVARRVADKPTPRQIERWMENHAVLAEATVTTDLPIVPTHLGNRTVWPVGEFNTVLWDPELALAYNYADKVTVRRAWLYDKDLALQHFAGYVLEGMQPQQQVYGAIPKRVLKHWSRCLVGRLGLRYRTWEQFGWQPTPDLRLVTFLDTDENTSTDMLIAGHDRLILSDMQEASESLPQIPGWVMSECRRRLWESMVDAGLRRVVYVDTDSMILRGPVNKSEETLDMGLGVHGWAQKGFYNRVTIHGPRNLVVESTRKVAGLPLAARQTAPLEFSGQVMRSIKESMRAGQLDCVASVPRKFVLDAPDLRRQHLPDGNTSPFHVSLPTEGVD